MLRSESTYREAILRLILIASFLSILLPVTAMAAAEQASVLIIMAQDQEPYSSSRDSALKHLAKLGYVRGENLTVKQWSIGNSEGRARRVWHEEKNNRYDAVYILGTVAVINFKQFAFNNPNFKFIFDVVTDPIGIGLIDAFDQPAKANFTGVSHPVRLESRLSFIKKIMPNAKKIGLIYADMPQSHSYIRWLEEALKNKEFADLEVTYRKVPFVKGEGGAQRMVLLAKSIAEEINDDVDLFMSPHDQLGAHLNFARMINLVGTKPLLGLGNKEVRPGGGATMSIFSDVDKSGQAIAKMIAQVIEGRPIQQLIPRWSEYSYTFNLDLTTKFGICIDPEIYKRRKQIEHPDNNPISSQGQVADH